MLSTHNAPVGHVRAPGARVQREPMVLEVQARCVVGRNAAAMIFEAAVVHYLTHHDGWAFVGLRIHAQRLECDSGYGEASVSLTLAEAKRVRDSLEASIAAAENGEAPSVVAR